MYRHVAAILIALPALAACQSAAPGLQQVAVFQGELARLKTERDAGRISYNGMGRAHRRGGSGERRAQRGAGSGNCLSHATRSTGRCG